MTKTFKKSLALILSVIMLMSVMPMSLSLAATEGDFVYEVADDKATIIGYNGTETDIVIPETLGGYPVVAIGHKPGTNIPVFHSNSDIVSVVLTDTIEELPSGSFWSCSNLKTVDLGSGIKKIGDTAFGACDKLTAVTIGAELSVVENNAFATGSITTINYEGSPEQWETLVANAGTGNDVLSTATKNFYYGHDCSTGKHITKKVAEKAPDCTETGNDEYWDCIFCELNFADEAATTAFTGRTEIDALGHEWSETLTQGDENHYIICTRTDCGVTKEDTVEAHNWVDATCTVPETCSICGKTRAPALEHDMADATCTEPSKCKREGCGYTEDDAKGHRRGTPNGDGPYDYFLREPTCTIPGLVYDIVCMDCEVVIEYGHQIPTIDHDYEEVEYRAPTCNENAENKNGYYHGICSMCGDDKEETIPALEHNYEVWTESELNPATCISLGVEFSFCTGCGKQAERATATLNPDKHTNLVLNEATAPDCENEGNIAYWSCEGCRKIYSDAAATNEIQIEATVLPAREHNFGDTWTYDEEAGLHKQICANDETHINTEACADSATDEDCNCDKCGHLVAHNFADATCTAPATCTVCGATTGTETGHDFGAWEYDAQTEQHKRVCENDETHTESAYCTDEDENCICDDCGRDIEHDFAPATCEEPRICRVCGEEDGEINPENHIGDTEVVTAEYREATCVSKEYTKYETRCLGCGEVLETEEVEGELDPDYHLYKLDVPNDGADKEHYEICEREGCDYKVWVDHELSGKITDSPATCTKEGRIREYCSICKSYIYTPIAKTAHVDAKKDGKCDTCGISVEVPADPTPETPAPENPAPENPSAKCTCNCHKSGLMGLFFKFILFFQKFFGINKICDCGKAHY